MPGQFDKFNSAVIQKVFTGTGNFTFTNEESVVIKKASGAATTVNLPKGTRFGERKTVIDGKGDSFTNNITVDAYSTQTINGALTYIIASNYGSATFEWNNTEWNVVSQASDIGEQFYSNTAASSAVTATSTETAFSTIYPIPAGTLRAGNVIKIRYQAIATATNSTDTLAVKLYLATATTAGAITGITLISHAATDATNNDVVQGEYVLVVRTVGASGTVVGCGTYKSIIAAEGTMTIKDDILASTALDTTVAQSVAVSATWSTNNAGNSARLDVLVVEVY